MTTICSFETGSASCPVEFKLLLAEFLEIFGICILGKYFVNLNLYLADNRGL